MCLGSKGKLSGFAGIKDVQGFSMFKSWNAATHMHVVVFSSAEGYGVEGKEAP